MKTAYTFIGLWLFAMLIPLAINSQQTLVSKVWENDGGTQFFFRKSKTVVDDNSFVYTIGETVNGYGNYDWYLEKYSPEGDTLFRRQFDGGVQLNDLAIDILVDNGTQEIYVVGGAVRDTADSMDMCIVKYDYNGDFLWSEFYDVSGGNDIAADIEMHPDGYFFVTGTAKTSDMQDMALLCYDNTGSLLFSRLYDGFDLNDIGIRLHVTWDHVFVSGGSQRNATTWDFVVRKYEIDGDLVNTSSAIAGVGEIYDLQDMAVDLNRNIYLTGSVKVTGEEDIVIAKLDSNLSVIWEETYAGNVTLGQDKGNGIKVDGAGNVYVTGYVRTTGQGQNMVLLKYSSGGTLLYDREYNSLDNLDDAGNALQVVTNGNIYIAGYTSAPGTGKDYLLASYVASTGKTRFTTTYDGTSEDDIANDIALDGNDMIITGQSKSGFTYQYITLKYSQYENPTAAVLDVEDNPIYKANELIIAVDPQFVNTAFVNDRSKAFADINDVLDTDLIMEMEEALDADLFENPDVKILKIFNQKTTDTLSISRGGYPVRVPKFWATLTLRLPNALNELTAADNLMGVSGIEWAEVNPALHLLGTNDPQFNSGNAQSSLKPTLTFPDAHINVDSAWAFEIGKGFIKVGIVDNGVLYTHEDFGTAVEGNLANSVVKGGINTDSPGELITDFSFPQGYFLHGTPVAGIIGALRDNSTGIASIAGGDPDTTNSGVQLYDIRVCCGTGANLTSTYASRLASGIFEGSKSGSDPHNGLHIMNLSLGGTTNSNTRMLRRQMLFARDNEVVMVVARGDVDEQLIVVDPLDSAIWFPACHNKEWLISVGGSGNNGERLTQNNSTNPVAGIGDQNFSPAGRGVDFIAPGAKENVTSIQGDDTAPFAINGYTTFMGTSSSCAHVTGVAALMMSDFLGKSDLPTNLNYEDIENILANTAHNFTSPGNYTGGEGWGIINAKKALEVIQKPYYSVLHFTAWLDNSDLVLTDSDISDTSGGFTFVDFTDTGNGELFFSNANQVDQYKASATIWHGQFISPFGQIIGHWIRNSYSDAMGDWQSVLGRRQANGWTDVEFESFDQDSAKLYGYLYNIPTANNAWLPYAPSSNHWLRLSYSVHVFDTTAETSTKPLMDENDFTIYPNPASDNISLQFYLNQSQQTVIEVWDMAGRKIETFQNDFLPVGVNVVTIPVSSLAAGSYFIRIVTDKELYTKKFIKQ